MTIILNNYQCVFLKQPSSNILDRYFRLSQITKSHHLRQLSKTIFGNFSSPSYTKVLDYLREMSFTIREQQLQITINHIYGNFNQGNFKKKQDTKTAAANKSMGFAPNEIQYC